MDIKYAGFPSYLHHAFGKCNPVWQEGYRPPAFEWPDHIVPVCVDLVSDSGAGMVIPMRIEPATQWRLSDAFGRFGSGRITLHEAFDSLLKRLEVQWESHFGTVLPLAWRQPFSITIDAPIHMEAIAGRSLQWPLALALLRASCTGRARMPFGPGPVFATGTLLESGAIGIVDGVEKKLSGFVREFGTERPVLLSVQQRRALNNDELEGLTVHVVNNLRDLFKLVPLEQSADMIAPPAREQDLDLSLAQMDLEAARVHFDRVSAMAEWLLPATKKLPLYSYRVRIRRGAMFLHGGKTEASRKDWDELRRLFQESGNDLDLNARADFAAQIFTYLMDSGASSFDEALDWFGEDEVRTLANTASAEVRAVLHGELSQFYRAIGDHERALECADRALELARIGQIYIAGKYNNFGIHALLARARQGGDSFEQDMGDIARRLHESRTVLCPTHDPGMRELHLGFCRHYEAEWHRLNGSPYSVRRLDRSLGAWDHPYLFTLLSCVRNRLNSFAERKEAAELLVEAARKLREWSGNAPIFQLFEGAYRLVHARIHGMELEPHVEALEALLRSDPSMALWEKRLSPHLAFISQGDPDGAVEALCVAIPHH